MVGREGRRGNRLPSKNVVSKSDVEVVLLMLPHSDAARKFSASKKRKKAKINI